MPEYCIRTSNTTIQSTRRPRLALRQAVCFGLSKMREPLLWIDQESINQDVRPDLQHHLQNMHCIYAQSRYTVAVLSQTIEDAESLDARTNSMQKPNIHWIPDFDGKLKQATNQLLSDPHFTRAWTSQEPCFAPECFFCVCTAPRGFSF